MFKEFKQLILAEYESLLFKYSELIALFPEDLYLKKQLQRCEELYIKAKEDFKNDRH